MILTILGAAGVRTPLIVREILRRQKNLHIQELRLMDIDEHHLALIQAIIHSDPTLKPSSLRMIFTTDTTAALKGADYVITTFRVGQVEARVIDETVAIESGCIGQETTGAGGFAMGLRTIPVMRETIHIMKEVCPDAWLINFANPSGMLTEAIRNHLDYKKAVGICDGPSSMIQYIARHLHVPEKMLHGHYFGLNHLGWFSSIDIMGKDIQPELLRKLSQKPEQSPLSVSLDIVLQLGMIPNEYLAYYYHRSRLSLMQQRSPLTRGQEVLQMNTALFTEIDRLVSSADHTQLFTTYQRYTQLRNQAHQRKDSASDQGMENGYAELALDLLEALEGNKRTSLILNIPNDGAIPGMSSTDIVEVTTQIMNGELIPEVMQPIPLHCLALLQQIKSFEKLTIEAALEGSYDKALFALTIHPLVGDHDLAKRILDGYVLRHGPYFPLLR